MTFPDNAPVKVKGNTINKMHFNFLPFQKKHLVLQCTGADYTRESIFLLKTILHFRKSPLHLHILADAIGNSTVSLLLDTWQLPAGW